MLPGYGRTPGGSWAIAQNQQVDLENQQVDIEKQQVDLENQQVDIEKQQVDIVSFFKIFE